MARQECDERRVTWTLPFLISERLARLGIDDADTVLDALRPEGEVTEPPGLRAIKASRVSFARTLLDRMVAQKWEISLADREIGPDGTGLLIYDIRCAGARMHFGVLSMPSSGIDRAGRLADTHFDFYAGLREGAPDRERMRGELWALHASLWSTRTDNGMLGFTIANRSMNNFTHVVETLAAGMQPDPDTIIANGGYVIRNAGWYGNGRHGTRAWKSMAGHPLGLPYHADMFALYLWRIASFDIVEAAALARNPRAARLSPATKAGLGVGNSSGMGMVAALVRWPEWFGAYNFVRELCLAHALTRPALAPVAHAQLVELLRRASAYHRFQPESPVGGFTNPETLSDNLEQVASHAAKLGAGEIRSAAYPLRAVAGYAATFDRETLEQTHSILIELYPDFAAAAAELLTEIMNMPRTIDPTMSVGTLTEILEARYDWALAIDLNAPGAREYFWYRSEESGENRRGERAVDAGVANETFVDVAGAMQTLRDELARQEPDRSIGLFLLLFPEFSRLVARAQLAQKLPYTEIRANIIDRSFRPCDAIRFLLSTMGLEAARPNNERYVRGVFLQGAPLPDDIAQGRSVDWIFPDIKPQPETASAR